MDASEEAEARAKVRHLIQQAPTARPPEFVNPLEKIEQLLTCPICLDRYKQPKLLPCQHTFCYPCLESCADSLHRTLKCPECRAEHSIPYDGVKAFQTNYTLTGFLEIHLQATPDSAAEIEEYIHRWLFRRIFRNVLVLYDVKKSLSHSATTAFRGFLNVVRLTPSHAGEQQLPDGAITARNAIGSASRRRRPTVTAPRSLGGW
ncbi:hypothetical protein Aduo_008763 [Ancylostoma duodenale]